MQASQGFPYAVSQKLLGRHPAKALEFSSHCWLRGSDCDSVAILCFRQTNCNLMCWNVKGLSSKASVCVNMVVPLLADRKIAEAKVGEPGDFSIQICLVF